ncbi:zinc finger protein 40 isoform X2 [Perognathus longimembris pacificus]|uniref:zinc finger protein 40 isoform X2 n=1 Tax=Perognathus longimembris pacificus TaxID=214514 RepID=UPI0020189ADC|nr:zinc finger protein 40 isoform X2 [Perognathus longimembris pacificus]XP_048204429.1 zinc finger protein 40 isoform X2 [Perognathus longimembris pacificus]XP_048204430.1 zinc finger protein 40 isoform X2 [Perognathus longimembris pacificus]XP_048204431.1 zinc finger protein 40 isoform X2 [Perognathus longimembris pacificus]XP_048204432.1 zinc finger protein 40 isoform X2 [Perognathus longimembris pacificus]XP_048204433.1 zinc finger protein 40 isoform X2 [Perognathus longimembris pacificus]
MPRTKQIHPRNLRDKIEEAQKELNGAEVSKKEILEAGVKVASESFKGVKRKKIVTENHLKKIPKSPLRNPLQAKHKQNPEGSSFAVPQSASESHRRHGYIPAKTGKQFAKQNGETPGITAEASKLEDSVPPRKPLFLQHHSELRRWRSEGSDPAGLSVLHDNQDSPGKPRTDNSECTPPHGSTTPPSPPLYTNTAFDVLLKAMEPELSTLSQKGSSCAIKTEKLRPNKTVRSPSKLKNTSVDTPTQPAEDSVEESQRSLCTSSTVHVAAAQKNEQASVQPVSHSYNPHEHLVSKPNQHNQQLPGHVGFTASLANLSTQEIAKLEQVYETAMTSTTGLTSPSNRTQVTPPNQQVDSASTLSISPANSTQSPPMPISNSAHVASVVNQSVEQMCNLLLRDQKPKKQGKYICEYCNRACAKPSVLLKHIRSHTGERPYPCVTCGFSFKTKSNLYKHKKSHAHTIKLGLVLQTDAGGLFLSQESPKALSVHSDAEESGESEEEGPADGRLNDPGTAELQPGQIMKKTSNSEALSKPGSISGNPDCVAGDFLPQDRSSESQVLTELPKVVVHPVSVSPLRTDSPKVISPKPELPSAQRQLDLQVTSILTHPASVSSLETKEKSHQKGDPSPPEGKQDCHGGTVHAQLQRQQATDYSQEPQGKLLSPRSLGSTDSGYFSRSESADQAVSPPTPFARTFPPTEPDSTKNNGPPAPRINAPAPPALPPGEKPLFLAGQMPPPLATKTLEERISKLISDNEALVDDKQLDSVKPRRTSLSRRGSIDSPKSYIFKDSFQFDLKPMGRRTSSSSDIPKSPFTPTEKSKQVFLLSVPSLDCLPITRSNSMPTTGYSAVPANIIPPPHPIRGSQSFDDKIGAFYDDVFVSGPNTSVPPSGHPRPLVRQAAVEDSSANENHVLGPGQSLDDGCQGCPTASEPTVVRSKAAAPGSHLEKKKSHQGRGTMFECETCRNRYRKLENFENHKKFYCSELHGPKTKVTVREPEQSPVPSGPQPQVLHYRVAGSTGVWEQTPQIRKRRKMKSVGDDEELQANESGTSPKSSEAPQPQNALGPTPGLSKHVAAMTGEQHRSIQLHTSHAQLMAQGLEQTIDPKLSTITEQPMASAAPDMVEVKRQGTGISVIQHTNSLSRPNSFDKPEPFETGSTVPFQELSRAGKPGSLKVRGIPPEEPHPSRDTSHPHQLASSNTLRGELQENSRKIASERHVLGQPSRLVRQHNIQVPEILVTEEPDRDLDTQCHDDEKSEKFSWPQRSETLSKLPTEKLPPKKKRLRLAEMEHSSTESSFDSTLSRSLSRESSLSHASSFSTSLDIEDASKTEAAPKIDFPNKAEFLLIPPGSNTLNVPGSHREMRRAASEQINCMPTLMEVSDFRSKSFDCGSITPPSTTLLVEPQLSTSPSMAGVTGHVPLLERRRGPLIRQISLNIAPDSHLSPVNLSSFPNLTLPSVNAVPFQGLQLPNTSSAEPPTNTLHSQTQAKDLPAHTLNPNSTTIFPLQQLFGISVLNQTHVPLSQQNIQLPPQLFAKEDKTNAHPTIHLSSASKDCFAPKYQLQCQAFTSGQACSSNPVHPLPNQVLPDVAAADQGTTSVTLPTKLVDPISKSGPLPVLELGPPGSQMQKVPSSFMLPVHLQSHIPTYCFATLTSLPQILVTQDLSNTSVCQTNQSIVPISEELNSMPESQKDHQNALPNPEKELVCKNVFSEISQQSSLSESSPLTQKMSVGRLSPQPESSASSKRMLSPANSLDIAMEKHQKRAKDENGAVCATDIISSEPLSSRINEGNKPKKPVLVRQLCTTDPLEGMISEQDGFSQSESSTESVSLTEIFPADNLSSGHAKIVIRESTNELQEFENIKSSTLLSLPDQNSSVPLENTHHISPLKSIDCNQEGVPSGVTNQGNKVSNPGQKELPMTTLPLPSRADTQQLPLPSLKTATSFTWCYLLRQKALPLPQKDQKTSAYTDWTVSSNNPNPLGLPTKVALSLLHSKQKTGKSLYCQAITTHPKSDLLVYSSKWKNNLSKRALGNQKSTIVEFSNKDASEINSEQDKENSLIKSEPRRIKIFDGGYKSNEEYVYVRGRGRGKYICEECGIRCKKPSMLKKHIRTHTDVRPYHCTYCNFSFKTKGNLTKHMKSKAHSKKCVDLGVSVALIDEQDTEESDEKQRFGYERSGCDLEDSDGPDEDDNDNEDDDEDSQAESVLSATPSVTASPQHVPSRSGLQDAVGVEEDLRITDCFSGAHTDPMDVLPRALLTKMTVLSTVQSEHSRKTNLPTKARQQAAKEEEEMLPSGDASRSPKTPSHQMFVDYPEYEVVSSSVTGKAVASTQDVPLVRLSPATAELSPQPAASIASPASPHPDAQDQKPQTALPPPPGLPSPQTHLFSHLPLHSQQQSRTPYNMVPVGGIHVVPAGLTYSTFVPIQAGPMQLTIPAVSVIHRTTGTPGDTITEVAGTTNPAGVTELSNVVPCFPIGQIRVPGLQNLATSALQSLTSLSMETVNIVGLANTNITPQVHSPGLALNAVGLQVLTANPSSQSNPAPPAHIPGLQILNIALPALIPSVGQVTVDAQGASEVPAAHSKASEMQPKQTPAASLNQVSRTESPQGSSEVLPENAKKVLGPLAPASDQARLDSANKTDSERAALGNHTKPMPELTCLPVPGALQKARGKALAKPPLGPHTLSPDSQVHRAPAPPNRPHTVHFSDVSSDEDEDRLVIAT